MKVCFICPEYPEGPHGGIGSIVQLMGRNMVQKGHEVKVIGIYPKSYPGNDFEIDQGVEVWRLRYKFGKFGWVLSYIKQYRIVAKWARKREIDIVEAPDSRGWFAFWPKLPVPLILRANGSNLYFSRILGFKPNKFTAFLEKKTYERADGQIYASKFTSSIVNEISVPKKKNIIIYNGINFPELDPSLKRVRNKILFAATLTRKKGIFQFLEAINILIDNKNGLEFTIDILGKDSIDMEVGSVKAYLDSKIPVGWENKIKFIGHVSRKELALKYQTCGLVVFPTFAEAFAVAPMEAMVCGCPVINSMLGSGKELIEDGINGLLIDPNHPAEIALAVEKLLSDEKLAERIGECGRQTIIEKFSIDSMVDQSLDFYRDVQKTL